MWATHMIVLPKVSHTIDLPMLFVVLDVVRPALFTMMVLIVKGVVRKGRRA